MKHTVRLILAAFLAVAIFSACTVVINDPLVEGDVYLAYYWDSLHPIRQFSDSNPWQPANIADNIYYRTAPGYYSGHYITYNGVYWYFDYTLTAEYAHLSDPTGPVSTYFQLWLSENGPYFYDLTYSRSLGSPAETKGRIAKSPAVAPRQSDNSVSVIEKTVNGYTMRLEYWKVE
jgi:hypothetical protein